MVPIGGHLGHVVAMVCTRCAPVGQFNK